MAPETFRENLWQDNDKNSPGTLVSPGAGGTRCQIYVLCPDSSARDTRSM